MKSDLRDIPGVGKAIEQDLLNLGVRCVADLRGQDPESLYARDCAFKGYQEDRCQLYVFRLAVYFAENADREGEKLKWWYWKDHIYAPRINAVESEERHESP